MLLDLMSKDFGTEGDHKDIFELFELMKYGRANLLFTDATKELKDVGSRDSYYTWVGEWRIFLQLSTSFKFFIVHLIFMQCWEAQQLKNVIQMFCNSVMKNFSLICISL